MRRFAGILSTVGFAVAIWTTQAAGALAQTPGTDGFVLAKPGDIQTERLPATPLVFGAYAIVWIVVTVYVLTLWRRTTKAEKELASLSARLEQQRR